MTRYSHLIAEGPRSKDSQIMNNDFDRLHIANFPSGKRTVVELAGEIDMKATATSSVFNIFAVLILRHWRPTPTSEHPLYTVGTSKTRPTLPINLPAIRKTGMLVCDTILLPRSMLR